MRRQVALLNATAFVVILFFSISMPRPANAGKSPDGDKLGGSMAEIVRNIAQLSDEDRKAIATYIKSLPKP